MSSAGLTAAKGATGLMSAGPLGLAVGLGTMFMGLF
jgi:hypothetical protein